MRQFLLLTAAVCALALLSAPVYAQDLLFSGYLDEVDTFAEHTFELAAGQTALLVARATSGDLDTVLTLYGPGGAAVADNDDFARLAFDSALVYTASAGGVYTARVEPYPVGGGAGAYELAITLGGAQLADTLTALAQGVLSGPVLYRDAPAFRVHYTLTGQDRTTEAFVDELVAAFEQVYDAQVTALGWPAPPPDGGLGGDNRFDIYVANLKRNEDVTFGYARFEDPATGSPNRDGYTSYFVIENDFKEAGSDNPLSLLRATLAHEFHHAIQFSFDFADAHDWVYEATSAYMEILTAGEDEDAVRYVAYNFDYPELCFGTVDDPAGEMMYGEWLFLQALADDYGPQVVRELWDNLALVEGFEALENTVAIYGVTVPQALARYRAKNLVRAYALAPQFDATVWLENTIARPGVWQPGGAGVQELGANYFAFQPAPGAYTITVDGPDALTLLAVGIDGARADVFDLGRGDALDTTGYDSVYIIVFHSGYGDVYDCAYAVYSLNVQPAGNALLASPAYTLDAQHFARLSAR